MVAVEPDRFFPVQDERVVVGLAGDIAFAADHAMLERWIDAFETWAPVESVEPAPAAMARALAPAGDGRFAFPLGERRGDAGVIDVRGGALVAARQLLARRRTTPAATARAVPSVATFPPTPLPRGVQPSDSMAISTR